MGSPNSTKNNDQPPEPQSDWALFLDIDGTLLDLAPTPETIVIPDELAPLISALRKKLSGAVAAVSGRTVSKIDEVFAPEILTCAGEHGSVIRLPDGKMRHAPESFRFPHALYLKACAIAAHWQGVLVEEKTFGICLHYRLAPHHRAKVETLAGELLKQLPGFSLLQANMALELRHHELNKGRALEILMQTPTFKGRIPVFIGDDVTDEDGFRAAQKAGGLGLHVDTCFGGQPANVRSWLKAFVNF